jgi:hypothetical protein
MGRRPLRGFHVLTLYLRSIPPPLKWLSLSMVKTLNLLCAGILSLNTEILTSEVQYFCRSTQCPRVEELQARRGSSGPAIVFNINQAHEASIRERWIHGEPDVVIHITGVVLLSGARGTRLLVQEHLRITEAGISWPTLRRGLIGCVSETINRIVPITTCPPLNNRAK